MQFSRFSRIRSLFLFLLLIIACRGQEQELESTCPSIKVLFLGNSFTEDAVSYVPFIINKIQPDIDLTIGVASIGACSLAQHYSNLSKKKVILLNSNYQPREYAFYKYISGKTRWENLGSKCVFDILKDENWDIITLQPSGLTAAKDWDIYYQPFLSGIQSALNALIDYPYLLGWVLIHGAYSHKGEGNFAQWEGAMENTKRVMSSSEARVLFPYGTAVQNLRTTPLCELGDGKDLLADNGHLQEGIGCLTAAYSIAVVLLQHLGLPNDTIINDNTYPSFSWNQNVCVVGPNYGESNTIIGITGMNRSIAQMAALFSIENPFTVTDCSSLYKK